MSIRINVTVNGVAFSHEVEPRLLLVNYLRDVLRLTGTHVGCDTSSCGACTIHVNGKATKSCTMLAVQADGCEITTIEGIAPSDDELHPLQEGFRECHGLQWVLYAGNDYDCCRHFTKQPQPIRRRNKGRS